MPPPDAQQRSLHQSIHAANDAAEHQAMTDSVAGNSEAFTRLVDRHASRCLSVARQVLLDEHMSQDAVQEAYLDLWKHANRFDPVRSPIGPWLVMLTHRRAVDRVRFEQHRPRPTDAIPDLSNDYNLEDEAHRTLLGAQTVELLRELPEGQRRCLMLSYWGGYTMTEIAKLMDIPVGTVKTRRRTALQRLRDLIRERGLDPRLDGP